MVEESFDWAQHEDRSQILQVVTEAFRFQQGTTKWDQAVRLIDNELRRFRVMREGGSIVATAYLCRLPIQVGSCVVNLGYIGQVAVAPDRQKQGRGTRLMQDLGQCLVTGNYDLARLSGLVSFYRRFGWTPFPRRFVEFPLQNLRAGTAEVSVSQLVHPDPGIKGTVRNYVSSSDRSRRDELVKRFNANRTGACQRLTAGRSRPLHSEDPRRWRLVYEQDGEIRGYIATHVFPEDVSDFESSVNLYELAFDLAHPESVIALLKYVLWAARRRGARRVTARLPWDHRLLSILRHEGLVFEQVELLNAATGNMLRIIDLAKLTRKILPELTKRWQAKETAFQGSFQLSVEDRPITLQLEESNVSLLENAESAEGQSALRLALSQHDFLRLLLGLNPPEAILEDPEPKVLAIMRTLFPAQPSACTHWG